MTKDILPYTFFSRKFFHLQKSEFLSKKSYTSVSYFRGDQNIIFSIY